MKTQRPEAIDLENGPFRLSGMENGVRLDSRLLEQRLQEAVGAGHRFLEIEAYGQHGIGGRLWAAGTESVHILVTGAPGQRLGAMGFPNTTIETSGPASDDVGWLNAGAEIIVNGNASNGVANGMAQGRISIAGSIGARGMTMTKHNPRFSPPELWVLGSVGDYFAEFMAGGTAVICGYQPQNPANVLGYRPCVGMVGGRIFFRGPHAGFSRHDAKLVSLDDQDWAWLQENLRAFLQRIHRPELTRDLGNRQDWHLLVARPPHERLSSSRRSMAEFRRQVWDQELGSGGLFADLTDIDLSPIPVLATGILRRRVPVWENHVYMPPCQASCPTGMPVQQRWALIREGRLDEAVDLALAYTPLPATVCGYLCPNLCMQACSRNQAGLPPVDVSRLGRASLQARPPALPPVKGGSIAVIGGGPAGLSIAWQLRLRGHEVKIFDRSPAMGGKITTAIPRSRIPSEVVEAELARIAAVIPFVHLQEPLTPAAVEELKSAYDFVVVAVGAQKPRTLPIPGAERLVPALDFLRQSRQDKAKVGDRVVIIGAGNVGCDVATEAHRLGARRLTLVDIQEPLSFGKERQAAEAAGAVFRYPVQVVEVTAAGVLLDSGELIEADTVILAIGDVPELDFLPDTVATERGFIRVNEFGQSSDPQIFAAGDAVRPGLLTEAIGSGRRAAAAISAIIAGQLPEIEQKQTLAPSRVRLQYLPPGPAADLQESAAACASCGSCRDCSICITICPESAISRREDGRGEAILEVDGDKCIGCGFCAAACPCGIWTMRENVPLENTI